MNWTARQHPLERLVEWLAPLPLALAGSWAVHAIGLPIAVCAGTLLLLLAAGLGVMRMADRRADAGPLPFEPAAFQAAEPMEELILEAKDELLELTDALGEVAVDSRVVQLFTRAQSTPGELVDRIADYLGESEREWAERARSATPVDASDALHAALANIRASLR